MKKQLLIEESEARSMWQSATPEFKKLLETTFGKEFFSGKITDRIKTYEDACAELEETPQLEVTLKELGLTTDEINYRKLKTIIKALVCDWKADWSDSDQQKWQPYFRLSGGVFVFLSTRYGCSDADAGYGSRLCFPTRELAEYAGKQFTEIYADIIQK